MRQLAARRAVRAHSQMRHRRRLRAHFDPSTRPIDKPETLVRRLEPAPFSEWEVRNEATTRIDVVPEAQARPTPDWGAASSIDEVKDGSQGSARIVP